jgi:2-succinyl-6-hydroxy-2,4-cyclohexadiene-1-carboxylate synthase
MGIMLETVARPVVIFVPGFMQRGEAWAPVAELVRERYPSALLDFRTHSFEGRLGELREAAGPGTVPVGYSMGGRLVLHLAAREPDRFAAVVTVGASPGIDDPRERERRRGDDEELAAWMERSTIDEVVARWERLPVFRGQAEELVAAQRESRLAHDPRLLAHLLRTAGQGTLPGIWDELPRLSIPVLALAGQRDDRYMAAARRIALLAPRGDALPVADAGHAAHLERPEATAELLLEFLDQHLGQGVGVDRDA